MENINFLRIPIYKLYYIEDISKFKGLDAEDIKSLKADYSQDEVRGIVESVKWATQNPDYNFSLLLPNLKYSNDEIYKYLCILEKSLVEF